MKTPRPPETNSGGFSSGGVVGLKIKIIGGTFPNQTSVLRKTGWHIRYDGWRGLVYNTRAALMGLEVISQSKDLISFKAIFFDGNEAVVQSHPNLYQILETTLNLGAPEKELAVTDVSYAHMLFAHPWFCLLLLLLIIGMFHPPTVRDPMEDAIEARYYAVGTNPALSEEYRREYKCSEAERLVLVYTNRGNSEKADSWKAISNHDCR